ncbi:Carbonate dehydratase [Psychromonas ingrahamii 37]|uniref:Carbonic anhydrase n=1 Tax=Psychromonas ingrahamii (strain DSM 17664 / CCUG 51855 / 37) TaxID=357804 RepID=A1SUY1_PSYIN|nr:carbonic anhydrase [Psychromonas ingrahamii]ABM03296.1 Carbonate dehydratase [Psychromonas ingrahamii 37]
MKKSIVFSCLLISSAAVLASADVHWEYSGEHGPEHWAKLSPDNFACSASNQSPVNLTGFIEADLRPIKFNYKAGGSEILNNGHTVQINYQSGSSINIDATEFALLQVHFHAPSENHIEGKSYPLEAHLVHADKAGNLAVVAVMYEQKDKNLAFADAWQQMPKHAGDKQQLNRLFNIDSILPTNRDYYRFSGSLTTPPCSEGVRWLVLKESVPVSEEQVKAFAAALTGPNNRYIQATNARIILK